MRSNRLLFTICALIMSYVILLGTTFLSLLELPELQPITLAILGLITLVWIVPHVFRREKYAWYHTDFDWLFLIWGAAFILSVVTNPETWRRSAEGLWFMALYIALWYALTDAIAQKWMNRALLRDAFLFTGVMVLIFALYQLFVAAQSGFENGLIRPESLFASPNAFGFFLVLIIPFTISLTIYSKDRILISFWGMITMLAVILLLLSRARSAYVGLIVALFVWGVLWLYEHDLLSLKALHAAWRSLSKTAQRLWVAAFALLGVFGLALCAYLLNSLSTSGRSLALRTYLWDAAWRMFLESPITGQGFFTYGHHLPRFASVPPNLPQPQAHNLPLHILAEMGLLGGIALLVTIGMIAWRLWHNWQQITPSQRPLLMAAAAGLAGILANQMFDVPITMPAMALAVLVVIVIGVAPVDPVPLRATWRKIGHPIGLVSLWTLLLIIGFWRTEIYIEYRALLNTALPSDQALTANDLRQSAAAFDPIIAADPYHPLAYSQQAFVNGLAAELGNEDALEAAIDGYETYLAMEPHHATAWANLAALYWQADRADDALNAIEQARQYAPRWQPYARQQQVYSGESTFPDLPTEDFAQTYGDGNWARLHYIRQGFEDGILPQTGRGS